MKNSYNIYRISGPTIVQGNGLQLPSNELVMASVNNNSKVMDTHNCLDTSISRFTVPVSGHYQVNYDYMDINGNRQAGSSIVIRKAGETIDIITDYISYTYGHYRIEGNMLRINLKPEFIGKPLEDLLPQGFKISPAATILFGPTEATHFKNTILIPIIR